MLLKLLLFAVVSKAPKTPPPKFRELNVVRRRPSSSASPLVSKTPPPLWFALAVNAIFLPPPLKGTTLQFLAPDASAFVGVFLAALREEEGKEVFEEEDARQLLKVDVAFISYATTLTTTQRERERKRGNSFWGRGGGGKTLSFLFSLLWPKFFLLSSRTQRRREKRRAALVFYWFELGCFFWCFLCTLFCTLSSLCVVFVLIRFCSLKKTFASEREESARRRTALRRTSSHRKELLLYIALYI